MSSIKGEFKEQVSCESTWLQYGLGAFETMRSVTGKIPLWNYHRSRLQVALKTWGCTEKVLETLDEAIVVEHSGMQRVKVMVGMTSPGKAEFRILRVPFESEQKAMRLLLIERRGERQDYKSCNYERHYLATQHAKSKGCDDAIYIDEGSLLECGYGTLCHIADDRGRVVDGEILDSVTRKKLLEDTFWSSERLTRETLGSGCLYHGNALRGLSRVSAIVDESGEETLVGADEVDQALRWNNYLFGESQ